MNLYKNSFLKSYTSNQIKSLFKKINKLKIFVVGDAMLDNYWIGNIERISPEAPVPILDLKQKDSRPGGSANVALNCKSLGAEVYLLSTIGKDSNGKLLIDLIKSSGIHSDYIIQSSNRITTTKTRIIAKEQQTLRIDDELTDDLNTKDEHHFIDVCLRAIQIEKPDILIFEDYNKGLLTPNSIEKIITHCHHVGVMTAVDPKYKNFFAYVGTDLFKPNLKEIKEALNLNRLTINLKEFKQIHQLLVAKVRNSISLITLSEDGVFIQKDQNGYIFPAHKRAIIDVSGAGDTVISVASIIYYLSKDIILSAKIANLAGGIVCEEVGVIPINTSKLLKESCEVLSIKN